MLNTRLGGFWARTAFTTHSRKCTHLSPCTGCFVSRATNRKHILCSECRLHTQNTHAHIPRVVHLIPAGGHRGSWSGPLSPAGCFTDLSTWFHPLSKLGSLKTSTFMPQERPGFGESRVWASALAVDEWFVSGENSRSVTQTLSRKLFWQEMSSWRRNALPRLTLDHHSLKNSDGEMKEIEKPKFWIWDT